MLHLDWSKLKILQTKFQNPTYITFFEIFVENWNNIGFMHLILLEILCWVRIWFRIWYATNGSLAITPNVSFLNKMFQSVLKWHILRYCKRTVCRTWKSKTIFGLSIKFAREWDTWRLYYFIFGEKYVGFWNIVCNIFKRMRYMKTILLHFSKNK